MPEDNWSHVTRTGDLNRVHGLDQKRRRERKDEQERDFKDILQESEKETEGFTPEKDEEYRPITPRRTMLDLLSTGVPPPVIQTIDEEPKKKDELKNDTPGGAPE